MEVNEQIPDPTLPQSKQPIMWRRVLWAVGIWIGYYLVGWSFALLLDQYSEPIPPPAPWIINSISIILIGLWTGFFGYNVYLIYRVMTGYFRGK